MLGPAAVVDHLVDTARPFIFDTGLAPAAAGAALAALDVLAKEPWLAAAARDRAADLARVAATAGLRRRRAGRRRRGRPDRRARRPRVEAAGDLRRARGAGRLLPPAVGAGRGLAACA